MKYLDVQMKWAFQAYLFLCGNLYQLPTARGVPGYLSITSIKGCPSLDLWREFLLEELTEVVRLRGYSDFIGLLNKI